MATQKKNANPEFLYIPAGNIVVLEQVRSNIDGLLLKRPLGAFQAKNRKNFLRVATSSISWGHPPQYFDGYPAEGCVPAARPRLGQFLLSEAQWQVRKLNGSE